MADPLLIAHAGHWLLWVLYLVPVVIVLFATAQAFLRERRARKEESPETG
jgi:cytochrome c-type biogenesis protein CcmH/NrfF